MNHEPKLYSPEFVSRYQYRKAPRAAKELNELTLSEFGYYADSFSDLAHFMLLTETHPHLPPGDPTRVTPEKLPPDYVIRYFGDYRPGSSLFRMDRQFKTPDDYPTAAGSVVGIAKFLESIHSYSRGNSKKLLGKVQWPEEVEDLKTQINKAIEGYQELVRAHGDDQTAVPAVQLEQVDATLKPLLARLDAELSKMTSVTTQFPHGIGEVTFQSNAEDPLVKHLPKTDMAHVLFFLDNASLAVADSGLIPECYTDASLDSVGAASLITDAMAGVLQRLSQNPKTQSMTNIFMVRLREKIKKDVTTHSRDLQMFGLYQRTLAGAYDIAYDDIDRMLTLCGQPIGVESLREPREAAVLLYAAAKRLERDVPGFDSTDTLTLAREAANCGSMSEVKPVLKAQQARLDVLKSAGSILEDNALNHCVTLVEDIVTSPMGERFTGESFVQRAANG
jgi:hypothetical protein